MGALIESFFYCLLASMIWAPIVFLAAAKYQKTAAPALADKIWPTALLIAALPVIAAPVAAAFGVSLRTAKPAPPMAEIAAPVGYVPAPIEAGAASPLTTITLASTLEAAAILYFYGFVMFFLLGLARHVWFAYRVRYAFDLDEPKLHAALEAWRRRIGVRRQPQYAFSDAVSSVCVHGFFRPVVLMPENLLDRVTIADAALMGAHEMAHIKRGDTALFASCTAAKAIFWFNPFMQRIAARANLAAEQAADALVIASGVDRRQYAHCFVQGLKFAAGERFPGRELVPSFTPFDKRSRRERLDAILSGAGGVSLLSLRSKIGLMSGVMLAVAVAFAQAALAVDPRPAENALPQPPVEGDVTLPFGESSEQLGEKRPTHEGVDIKAKRGAVVRAAGNGKVIDATERYRGQPAWGKVVVIDHGHGLVTRYAHLDSYLVRKGETVKAGDVIGAVGSTGKATGPHLHFEVIRDGVPIDPAPVIAAAPMPAPAPVHAPAPKPVLKTNRTVMVTPLPEIARATAIAPDPAPRPTKPTKTDRGGSDVSPSEKEKLERKLEGGGLKAFRPFDGVDDFSFEFGDMDLDDFDGVETAADALSDMRFAFAGLDGFDIEFLGDGESLSGYQFFNEQLSEEDREKLRRAQEEAMRKAAEAVRKAKIDIDRAKRDMERAYEHAERERKRALEQAERDRERAERERERALEQAERDRERAERERERVRERIEREHEIMRDDHVARSAVDEEERLRLREEAIKQAQRDLNEELAKIERERAALKQKKRDKKSD